MAKKVDPLKAKAAKQKKMAIGLSVMFVAVLAFQGPKTLKMLKGPAAAPVVETAAATPIASTTATGAVPPGTPGAPAVAAGAPATGAEAQPAVLVDSDLPAIAGAGQLLSFERFDAADPFDQQVDPNAIPVAQASVSASKSGAAAGPAAGPAAAATDGAKAGATGKSGSVVPGAAAGVSGAGTSGSTAAPSLAVQSPSTATTLSLNGAVVELVPAAEFPADDPVFVFVSAAQDGKSIEIGIAGGVYADGDETITLKLGKSLTLQNTADGSRFELELLTVQGFVPPKPKK